MSAFKKKAGVSEQTPSIQQINNQLNLLLGLGSSQLVNSSTKGRVTKDLILGCAMFWDSKKRVDKIKSLVLKQQGLEQFADSQDFQISQLMSIQLLSLSKNKITNLQPLSTLDTLLCLNINYNKVYNLSPLSSLLNLQQLYASHNQISYIDALKPLKKLRILNLYSNKLTRIDQVITVLGVLEVQELDVEANGVDGVDNRGKFLGLKGIVRFNGEIVRDQEREGDTAVLPAAKFRDTHTSFFPTNKSQVKTTITDLSTESKSKFQSKQQLSTKIQQLQKIYFEIDDKFQQQIVKNVQLKSQYCKLIESNKIAQRKLQENKDKQEEIVQLKRKVKMLKQNLFNSSKGQLLRQLFQLQMTTQPNAHCKQKQPHLDITSRKKQNQFLRKFDFDEEIFINLHEESDNKYLFDDDQEIAQLLSDNNSALQQIKRELREMNC